jgi:hypothetical protein
MSIKLAAEEIRRFLKTSEPEVLCLKGRWGVGKTYAWNRYLNEARGKPGEVAMERYAYVSLFGRDSLADVRSSIVENSVGLSDAGGVGPKSVKRVAEQGLRLFRGFGMLLPQLRDYAAFSDRLLFAALRSQLVCIDDLERAGEGLKANDVLGLVCELRDQKGCKVVLILNDEELKDGKQAFDAQIEKVADTIIDFAPTPAEAVAIGVDSAATFAEELRGHCVALGLTNIRIIKRVERMVQHARDELQEFDERILKQATHTLALFVCSKYQPGVAPSPDFIRSLMSFEGEEEGQGDERRVAWRSQLSDYGFTYADELDVLLLDGVARGYFDNDALRKKAGEKQKALAHSDKDKSMRSAWALYHDSFDDNEHEVLSALEAAFRANYTTVTPLNVSGLARLFRDLGQAEKSRELVELYVENRDEPPEFWNLKNHAYVFDITDPDVIELFGRKSDAMAPAQSEDIGAILVRISKKNAWGPKDVQRLSEASIDDYYKTFKGLRGEEMRCAVSEALLVQGRGGENSAERKVAAAADAALKRIADESRINARRVALRRSQM